MNAAELARLTEQLLAVWNSQSVERVVACYAEDVRFSDPITREVIVGIDALRCHLRRQFSLWTLHWTLREAYPLSTDQNGAVILWHAKFRPIDGTESVDGNGISVIFLRNGQIGRSEMSYDRTVLLQLKQ